MQLISVYTAEGRFYLQVLFNVFSVVCDTAGSDTRLPHQLKADLSTQVVWNFTLLPNTKPMFSQFQVVLFSRPWRIYSLLFES